MDVVETVAGCRALLDQARAAGRPVGLVPTMGALHDGHRSLMARARAECDVVAVSIFVNPLQFGDPEDIARYPRTLERDLAVCAEAGADVVFVPTRARDVPVVARRAVDDGVGARRQRRLGGRRRGPGHFDGVATVVAKLFAIAGPCRAYFGVKDFQQLAVVRRHGALTCRCRSRWWGAPSCARPTGWPSPAATSGSRPTSAGRRPCCSSGPWPPGRAAWPAGSARARPSAGPCAAAVADRAAGARSTTPWRSTPTRCQESDAIDDPPVGAPADRRPGGPGAAHRQQRRARGGRRRPAPSPTRPTRSADSKGSGEPMRRRMMKSKIHRATVTGANLHYVGSVVHRHRADGAGRHPALRAGGRPRHRQRRALRDLRHRGRARARSASTAPRRAWWRRATR